MAGSGVPKCKLWYKNPTNNVLVADVHCGLKFMEANGLVEIEHIFEKRAPELVSEELPVAAHPTESHCIEMELGDGIKIHLDMIDSDFINPKALERVDFYFKRSYYNEKHKHIKKVYPYGLILDAYPKRWELEYLMQSWKCRKNVFIPSLIVHAARSFPFSFTVFHHKFYTLRIGDKAPPPVLDQEPSALFLTRTWAPDEILQWGVSDEVYEKIKVRYKNTNDMRAECIAALRKHFPEKTVTTGFYGKYARQQYPSLMIKNERLTHRPNFIKLMKKTPVAAVSSGLHDSIGMRVSEAMLFSRALVTEKITQDLPGSPAEGKNYLSFSNAEECVEAVGRLLEDKTLRQQMMTNNYHHFNDYIHPFSKMKRIFKLVLEGAPYP